MNNGNTIEESVRAILSKDYGVTFNKRRLTLEKRKRDGSPKKHEFDIVSPDRQIVGEIKSYKYTPKAQANTRLPRVMMDCLYLSLVSAKTKLMVLTDKEFYDKFKEDSDGLLPEEIKIIHRPV